MGGAQLQAALFDFALQRGKGLGERIGRLVESGGQASDLVPGRIAGSLGCRGILGHGIDDLHQPSQTLIDLAGEDQINGRRDRHSQDAAQVEHGPQHIQAMVVEPGRGQGAVAGPGRQFAGLLLQESLEQAIQIGGAAAHHGEDADCHERDEFELGRHRRTSHYRANRDSASDPVFVPRVSLVLRRRSGGPAGRNRGKSDRTGQKRQTCRLQRPRPSQVESAAVTRATLLSGP